MVAESGLPEFELAPVVETVLSVRFREVAALSTARIIRFWEQELASEFPNVEEQPPYPAPIEQLGPDSPFGGFPLSLESGYPSPRFWFTGGAQLVQLQRDWAAFNWRQAGPGDDYIRYRNTRERFAALIEKLTRFVELQDGKLEPVQCEVTYVNHIHLLESDLETGALGHALQGVSTGARVFLPAADSAQFASSYAMRTEEGGQQVGRLHVIAESARIGPEREPGVILNLTARGRPLGAGLDGVLEFCDLGRRWIVNGFRDLTTPSMHKRWKIKEITK